MIFRIHSLVILVDLIVWVQLLNGIEKVFIKARKEIAFRGRARLHVVRAQVPQVRQAKVPHEELLVGDCILDLIAELPLPLSRTLFQV